QSLAVFEQPTRRRAMVLYDDLEARAMFRAQKLRCFLLSVATVTILSSVLVTVLVIFSRPTRDALVQGKPAVPAVPQWDPKVFKDLLERIAKTNREFREYRQKVKEDAEKADKIAIDKDVRMADTVLLSYLKNRQQDPE